LWRKEIDPERARGVTAEGRRGPCRASRFVIGFAIDIDLVLVLLIVIEDRKPAGRRV
jgi:hypothetical protein